jgi:glycosyltransferase involved in cell wall biosynthesis
MKPIAKPITTRTGDLTSEGQVARLEIAHTQPVPQADSDVARVPPAPKTRKRKARWRKAIDTPVPSAGSQAQFAALAKDIDVLRRDVQSSVKELREALRGEIAAAIRSERPSLWWRLARIMPDPLKNVFLRSFGEMLPPKAQAEHAARIVWSSGYFDANYYMSRAGVVDARIDPAFHYVTVGERLGIPPSMTFDPGYYGDRHPDVAKAGMCYLAHYVMHGRNEGRRPRPALAERPADPAAFAPNKKSIILVSHEATRTGAPILALNIAESLKEKYNLITILLRGGDLVESFERLSSRLIVLENRDRNAVEFRWTLKALLDEHNVRYAVINSLASWDIIPSFAETLIPTVTLIHEFSAYMRPLGFIRPSLGATSELVFSTAVAANSFCQDHQALLQRRVHILPQGYCRPILEAPEERLETERERLRAKMRPEGMEDAFVVLGAGFVHIRKGVDLFLASAAAAQRLKSKRPLRFVWIGQGYDPDEELSYSVYLSEQIARSGLADHVVMLDEVVDLETAYEMADAFYMASRLDPLPNVTIDAAMRGLPVICFKGATGIAEVLERNPEAAKTVMPYLDAEAAARRLVELAANEKLRRRVGKATHALAARAFDMDDYVRQIDKIGNLAVQSMRQRKADYATLIDEPGFDVAIASPPNSNNKREETIARFMTYWTGSLTAPQQVDHLDIRRPCPGFNPQIYAHHHPELARTGTNPFADFLRKKRPNGPWLHRVIRPGERPKGGKREKLRVAVQAHFHYPDLIEDFLERLAANEARCDLLLSTNEEDKAEILKERTKAFKRGRVEVRVVPNRGRDVGPLLTAFGREILRDYDVVGHFHSKRSENIQSKLGDRWREFLWEHLLGRHHSMMDLALAHFASDPRLGLIFAEEPHLTDWSGNREIAEKIGERAGFSIPFPPFFEYPVGNMFWVRTTALAPLVELGFDWSDYPKEPVDKDGTILHALERLIPFSARKQELGFATLHISGITW